MAIQGSVRIVVSHGGMMEHILGCVFGSLAHTRERYFIACPALTCTG
jgi:hypothetical protein